ncbi:hypothetical protein [Roseomonas mucosa]|uniref:hypothetical protein n=1 Tax=Roseomonas mucosa TaxID=207340 RepID=UPI0012398B0D|nr:hypothetical protein [Roseomonas mucosa]QET91481.1 hypothetical protein FOB66_00700 [Roseomonas mucosa]
MPARIAGFPAEYNRTLQIQGAQSGKSSSQISALRVVQGRPDMVIELAGTIQLASTDFIL